MLTADGFDQLLRTLDADPARAASAYEHLRARLSGLLRWWGSPDGEELADRTLERVARKLAEGAEIAPGSVGAYVRGVARRVYYEAGRETRAELDARAEVARHRSPPANPGAEALLGCLDRCLDALAPRDRDLVLRYYADGKKEEVRRQLAQELDLTPTALRIRVHRLRERLAREMAERLPPG